VYQFNFCRTFLYFRRCSTTMSSL